MANARPLVSVSMITYNHEQFIAESIQSVLDQTLSDLELIIVNDGSTDRTDEIIRSFKDDRIVYIPQPNQGPCVAARVGNDAARGTYLAFTSGDDVCDPRRLEVQLRYLRETGHQVLFSWAEFIDDESRVIRDGHFAEAAFNHPNRLRPEMLEHFFFHGNYLCCVSLFADREVIIGAGPMSLTTIQLQDFELWVRLIKSHELFVIPEKLVRYRVRSGGQNLSSPSKAVRIAFESLQIWRTMLDDVPMDLFKAAFHGQMRTPGFADGLEYALEKAFLFLKHQSPQIRCIGGERLFQLLQDESVLDVSKQRYGFDLPALYRLTQELDFANMGQLSRMERDLDERGNAVRSLGLELDRAREQIERAREQIEALSAQGVDLQRAREQVEARVEALSAQLATIEGTRIWRLWKALGRMARRVGLS